MERLALWARVPTLISRFPKFQLNCKETHEKSCFSIS